MAAYVYAFADGSSEMRDLLGGKGAELAEMTAIGLPVPDGFTVTTEACRAYLDVGATWPDGLDEEVSKHWRSAAASASATRTIRSWSRSARAHRCRCRG
jgi:pyruvate,orthophosphate dikinase